MSAVRVTHLEMRAPGELRRSSRVPDDVLLLRALVPTPELGRFLYAAVGAEWQWRDRLRWSDEQWRDRLARPEVELWVLHQSGTPAGYFELEAFPEGEVELVYFGLLPGFPGKGLGGYLLTQAVDRAWRMRPGVRKVRTNTCTLDHPQALPNYLARGFAIVGEEERVTDLSSARREYAQAALDEASVDRDPLRQFLGWMDDARRAALLEPNAMILATATAAGVPSARVVLLKGADPRGFVFFTDSRSRKGRELDENPLGALVFWWGELERQVRVSGRVERVSDAESDAYYRSRPEGSRISAWASHQSSAVPSRGALESQWEAAAARLAAGEIPRPPYWGGYRLEPDEYEFWQGRPNRLHDRLRFRRQPSGDWLLDRLSP